MTIYSIHSTSEDQFFYDRPKTYHSKVIKSLASLNDQVNKFTASINQFIKKYEG